MDSIQFVKQPDDTAWSIDCDNRIKDGIRPLSFTEWKTAADNSATQLWGVTIKWDELTNEDMQWIADREKYNMERYEQLYQPNP